MDRLPRFRSQKKSLRRASYRPMLETLEDRLPPGDLLGATLFSSDALLNSSTLSVSPVERTERPSFTAREDTGSTHSRLSAPVSLSATNEPPLLATPLRKAAALTEPFASTRPSSAVNELFGAVLTGGRGFFAGTGNAGGSAVGAAPATARAIDSSPTSKPPTETPTPPAAASGEFTPPPPPPAASPAAGPGPASPAPAASTRPAANQDVATDYGQLPLSFEANLGQTDAQVQFLSRGNGYSLFLTGNEAVLQLQHSTGEEDEDGFGFSSAVGDVVRMEVVGAREGVQAVGRDTLAGRVNYFLGNDPSQWRTDLPTFGAVEYSDIYDGIDLVYYGSQRQLEFDFVVAPGANPNAIALRFTGAEHLSLDEGGNLVLDTNGGQVVQQKPILYQEVNGVRQEIAGSFVLQGEGRVSFAVGEYDTQHTLVIDPVLSYSTYLGGSSSDLAFDVAVGSDGSAYLTGQTRSTNFPVTAGTYQGTLAGTDDVFVTKINPAGNAIVYSTYLGGSNQQRGSGIAVDASGNAYITGRVSSTTYPTTPGALSVVYGGGLYDAFVTKLNPSGNGLVYSTFLGGNGQDSGFDIVLDSDGNAHLAGGTNSPSLQVSAGGYLTEVAGTDAFYIKLNSIGSKVLYGTYYGGSGTRERGNSIGLDAAGNAYLAGRASSSDLPISPGAMQPEFGGGLTDGFVACFNPFLSGNDSLLYATYIGGTEADIANGIAVDAAGNAYVVGETESPDFPLKTPFQATFGSGFGDAFVLRLNPGGSLGYSTYLGGIDEDRGFGIAVNAVGQAHVTGFTSSLNFPRQNPTQTNLAGGRDAFVTKLNASGNGLIYSTYLGGSGDENDILSGDTPGNIALDGAGNMYVTGRTSSTNFPAVSPLQPLSGGLDDSFLTKIVDDTPLQVSQFLATPNGFTAQFNRAFDPAVLNLYDTQAGGLGPADVTLVGASTGVVNGSLVLDANNRGFTFVRTGGLLPADTYTVTLRSAANGFKEVSSGLLDGNGDRTTGDNFVTTFAMAASSIRSVSVADFSRGPNQVVNLPANSTRLPLRLSDGTQVTSITLTLRYNPNLLTLTGVQNGPGTPVDSISSLTSLAPGVALLTFSTATGLSAGPINFVTLAAQVPAGATLGASHVLDITNLAVIGRILTFSIAVDARSDDGVHAVAYFGDATGNGSYTSADATRIQRVATGLDSGFAAYVRTSPVIIADITGNGRVDSTDATRVLQEAVGIDRPEIPPLT